MSLSTFDTHIRAITSATIASFVASWKDLKYLILIYLKKRKNY